MRSLEVVLLETDPDHGGVRVSGRTADPEIIELVRDFLIARLNSTSSSTGSPELALVPSKTDEED